VKHSDRMFKLADGLHPPKGSAAFAELQEHMEATKNNPTIQAALKKNWAVARASVLAQIGNGAGREGDEILRYFMVDACNRFWSMGVWDTLPASFNVTSDFMEHLPARNFFRILPEVDHEFCLSDFLDFVTSGHAADDLMEAISVLPEGQIQHFTNISPLEETTTGDRRSQQFVLASCSMIRHEEELSTCVVLGQSISAAEKVIEGLSRGKTRMYPGKEKLREVESESRIEAVELRADRRWWKVLLLTRFDLRRRAFQVRYVLRDCGNSFDVISDDPSIWLDAKGNPIEKDWENLLRNNTEKLRDYGPAFELSHYAAFLPQYFNDRSASVRPVNVRTEFGANLASFKYQRKVAAAQPETRMSFKTILRMASGGGHLPNSTVAPATLRIERSGYWKTLRPDQVGVDRDGNSIEGKTWVSKELTWVEAEKSSDEFHIERQSSVVGDDPGSIYVMRSAAHPEDVFKIGLTRREVEHRADELGASTGAADKFLIVQRWSVGNCTAAEALIHEELDSYRLTSHREFFKARYEVIREVVERIVSRAV
jgi:T5orf172 domain